MLPSTNQTDHNLRLPNLVQHISLPNGKNSHIRKKMHQSLLEYLQIRTQRIQKICKKQNNLRPSQHSLHRLSHLKDNKPLRASGKDKRKQLNLQLLIPERRILQKHSDNRLHPLRSFPIPRRKKLPPKSK